ncbi:MAG: hypothetical protein D6725_11515, partial [Planctomycetota bacterium]
HEGTGRLLRISDASFDAPCEGSPNDSSVGAARPSRQDADAVGACRTGGPQERDAACGRGDMSSAEHASEEKCSDGSGPTKPQERLCHVGWYRIDEAIGRGGMGCVFRARDETLNREVAIKVVERARGPETPEARRFLNEALITAQLEHPGIPAVHGLGIDSQGRPFLAMKLVAGRTLAELLRERTDVGAQRGRFVAIFEQICHAVGYAHDHGVIHRDLKPSNVMVGAHGEVQVMDWGLAKVVGTVGQLSSEEGESGSSSDVELETAETVDLRSRVVSDTPAAVDSATRTGVVLGTPRYMSPEQAAGEVRTLDPRCDVFGLGAILCEILTGKPPYTGGDPRSVLLKAVRGDLQDALARLEKCGAEPEWVALCRRCLAFRREDRPENGRAVAEEAARIRQQAEDRARAAEMERLRLTVRQAEQRKRRKLLTAATVVVLLVLTAGVVGTSLGLIRAEQAARKALAAQQRAEAERDAKARALQAEQEARAQEQAARERAQAALRLMTDQLVENVLATRSRLTPAHKRFLRVVLRQYETFADAVADAVEGRVLHAQGLRRVAMLRRRLGDLEEAEAACRKAVQILRELVSERPRDGDLRKELSTGLVELARILKEQERMSEAEPLAREALEIARRVFDEAPDRVELKRWLASQWMGLAELMLHDRRFAEADECLRAAAALYREVLVVEPDDRSAKHMLGECYRAIGGALAEQDKFQEALEPLQQAIAIHGPLAQRFPADVDVWVDLGSTYHSLGIVYRHLGRLDDSAATLEKALEIRRRLARENPGLPELHNHLGDTLASLGFTKLRLRDFVAAAAYLEEAANRQQIALRMRPRSPEYREARRTALVVLTYAYANQLQRERALQTAETIAALNFDPPMDLFRAGRTLARCMRLVDARADLNDEQRRRHLDFFAEHALRFLQQAVAEGFNDGKLLDSRSYFELLRQRPEFQQLRAKLAERQSE